MHTSIDRVRCHCSFMQKDAFHIPCEPSKLLTLCMTVVRRRRRPASTIATTEIACTRALCHYSESFLPPLPSPPLLQRMGKPLDPIDDSAALPYFFAALPLRDQCKHFTSVSMPFLYVHYNSVCNNSINNIFLTNISHLGIFQVF